VGDAARRERQVARQVLAERAEPAILAARLSPPSCIVAELGERPSDPVKAKAWDKGVRAPLSGTRRSGRYHRGMAQATKLTDGEIERRRAAAERLRGLFADVSPDRSLVDELIADRRAEARAEGRESKAERRARS